MKKIVIILFSILLLTSCFGEEEKITKIIKKNDNFKNKIIESNKTNISYTGATKEVGDFILEIEKKPNILRKVNCDKFKFKKTKKECFIKKNELINNKNITKFKILKDKYDIKQYKYFKGDFGYQYIIRYKGSLNGNSLFVPKSNFELISYIKEINSDNNNIYKRDCLTFKNIKSIDFCKKMKIFNFGKKEIEIVNYNLK